MAARRNRKPAATIQKNESRQFGPTCSGETAGVAAADCEVNVFTAIVGKFSYCLTARMLDLNLLRAKQFGDNARYWPRLTRFPSRSVPSR